MKMKMHKRERGPVNFTRFQHVLSAVYGQPWLITPHAHGSIQSLIRSRIGDLAIREGEGMCGELVELESMSVDENGIATIPIGGALARKLSGMEKGSGAIDMLDIQEELKIAVQESEIRGVILDIDSPGGTVNGTPETADMISSVSDSGKPVYAFSAGMIASGAYWLASTADGIFATRSAQIGSVGVYMAHFDESVRFAQEGVKVDLIKSGDLKAIGFPGIPLSEDQREHLQSGVIDIHREFKEHIRLNRGDIDEDSMRGQVFSASEASDRNLIDGIVSSMQDVKELLLQQIGS